MADSKYSRIEERFLARGLDLNTPSDRQRREARYPILKNVRRVIDGTIRQRPGLNFKDTTPLNGGGHTSTPWHSVRRLNDKLSNANALISGVGDCLVWGVPQGGANPLNLYSSGNVEIGFSGNPLTLIPFQPEQGNKEWMAAFDSVKMRKVDVTSATHKLGVVVPTEPPILKLGRQLWKDINQFNSSAGWVRAGGSAGAFATPNRVNTTLVAGHYAQITVGEPLIPSPYYSDYFSLELASTTLIGPGTILTTGTSNAIIKVMRTYPQSISTTVAQAVYDSGSTGWCTITGVVDLSEAEQYGLLNVGSKYLPIQAVIVGVDNRTAIRVYDNAGGTAIATGQTLQIRPSVWAWVQIAGVPLTDGETVTDVNLEVTNFTGATSYTFTLDTSGSPLDLSTLDSTTQVDRILDEMHISMFLSGSGIIPWDAISEMKVMLDVDDKSFQKNWYERSIRPNDRTPISSARVTPPDNRVVEIRRKIEDLQRRINNLFGHAAGRGREDNPQLERLLNQLEELYKQLPEYQPYGSSSTQAGTGNGQWSEIKFKLADLQRFGEDTAQKDLRSVQALRILVVANKSTDTFTLGLDSWWIGGGYAPDVSVGAPYEYRYRYRVASTNARSNWAPTGRIGANAHRTSVSVWVPILPGATQSEVDKIDIQRRGGTVNDWRTIATIPNLVTALVNGASCAQFTDIYSDDHAIGVGDTDFGIEGNVNAQPFTIGTDPASGNLLTLAGTMLVSSAALFNTSWAQGTPITVNGIPTLIYRVLSTTIMEVYGPCGSGTGSTATVPWEIPAPMLTNQPLPIAFGPADGWYFGVGDTRNPGRLYFFNRWTLDSTQSTHWIDVTDGSDSLMNGCAYNGRAYVWSTRRMYVLSDDPVNQFRADPVPAGVGMYAKWALATGNLMYWLSSDGIYASDGSDIHRITDDLAPLMLQEGGVVGATTNGIQAPLLPSAATAAQQSLYRLSYCYDRYLYFDYDSNYTLMLDRGSGSPEDWGWFYDVVDSSIGVAFHYAEEGEGVRNVLVGGRNATAAKLYTLGGAHRNDAGTAFTCQVRTFSTDGGDLRPEKLFGDGFLDVDPGNTTVTSTWYFDYATSSVAGPSLTGSTRPASAVVADFSGGTYARNCAVDLQWTVPVPGAGPQDASDPVYPILYEWGVSIMGRPEQIQKRATDYSTAGYAGPKYIRGVYLHADTGGSTKAVKVDYTNESGIVAQKDLSITHTVKTSKYYAFDAPFIAMALRISSNADATKWRLYEDETEWVYEKYPPLTTSPTPWTNDGDPGAKFLKGLIVECDSENAARGLTIKTDKLKTGGGQVLALGAPIVSQLHDDRVSLAYSTSNVVCHLMQLVPSVALRIFSIKWLWDPWPEYAAFFPDRSDLGYPGPKYLRGIDIEADTRDENLVAQPIAVLIEVDGAVLGNQLTLTHEGRTRKPYPIDLTVGSEVRLLPQGALRIFHAEWIYDKYPELSTIVTEWTDDGRTGPKYLQGFVLNADTGNFPIGFDVQGDTGAVIGSFTAQHNGQVEKSYSLSTPVVAHNMRIVPTGGTMRIFNVKWIWQPEAPLGDVWHTQEFELGDPYGFAFDAEVEYASVGTITFQYLVDGVSIINDATKLLTTGGTSTFVKKRIVLPAVKGRMGRLKLSSTSQFRLRISGTTLHIKGFDAEKFTNAHIAGGKSNTSGAPV